MVVDGWGRPDSIGGHEYAGVAHAAGRLAGKVLVSPND